MADASNVDDRSRVPADGLDLGDFAGRLRLFAFDTHRILHRPETSLDELLDLQWQSWCLLDEAQAEHTAEIARWVLAIRRAIVARLRERAPELVEAVVA